MKYAERITNKLRINFLPELLEVVDESDQHAGHIGARPGGETHFKVKMVSDKFIGKSRIERQREVYKVLKVEMAERIHALSLELIAPNTEE